MGKSKWLVENLELTCVLLRMDGNNIGIQPVDIGEGVDSCSRECSYRGHPNWRAFYVDFFNTRRSHHLFWEICLSRKRERKKEIKNKKRKPTTHPLQVSVAAYSRPIVLGNYFLISVLRLLLVKRTVRISILDSVLDWFCCRNFRCSLVRYFQIQDIYMLSFNKIDGEVFLKPLTTQMVLEVIQFSRKQFNNIFENNLGCPILSNCDKKTKCHLEINLPIAYLIRFFQTENYIIFSLNK